MDALALFQATIMVLSDRPTQAVDALFFHAKAKGDDKGLFELASELKNNGLVRNVVINGSDGEKIGGTIPGEAWPGKSDYIERLKAVGVEDVLCAEGAFNTGDESKAFLKLAKTKNWKTAVCLTQPDHALRVALGMIRAIKETGSTFTFYIAVPTSANWWDTVAGSQGEMTRFEHIFEEFERIRVYPEAGILVTLEELFDYMKARN